MRPLFALVLPQYFAEAPRYLKHRTFKVDVAERREYLQNTAQHNSPATRPNFTPTARSTNSTRPSTAQTRSSNTVQRSNTTQTRPNTAQTRPSTASRRPNTAQTKADTPILKNNNISPAPAQEGISLDDLHSIFSSPTGRSYSSPKLTPLPLPTPRSHRFQIHSRSASNASVQSTTSAADERSIARLQAGFDPLRMSPISPSSPDLPAPLRVRKMPSLPPGSWMRRPSNATTISKHRPKTPGSDKQLPVTPFPIASAR